MNRPRQHELEELSRRRFRNALPICVQPRDESPDYGFDLQLELFRSGKSTGMRWFVQVKAREGDTDDAHRARFTVERLMEYRIRTRAPVMLVHYDADQNLLRFMWDTDAIAQLSTRDPNWLACETVSVSFAEAPHLVTDEFEQFLDDELGDQIGLRENARVCIHFAKSKDRPHIAALLERLARPDNAPEFLECRERDAEVKLTFAADWTASQRLGDGWLELARQPAPPSLAPGLTHTNVLSLPPEWSRAVATMALATRAAVATLRPGRHLLREDLQIFLSGDAEHVCRSVYGAFLAPAVALDGSLEEFALLLARSELPDVDGVLLQWVLIGRL